MLCCWTGGSCARAAAAPAGRQQRAFRVATPHCRARACVQWRRRSWPRRTWRCATWWRRRARAGARWTTLCARCRAAWPPGCTGGRWQVLRVAGWPLGHAGAAGGPYRAAEAPLGWQPVCAAWAGASAIHSPPSPPVVPCPACRRALVDEVRERYEVAAEAADACGVRVRLSQVGWLSGGRGHTRTGWLRQAGGVAVAR